MKHKGLGEFHVRERYFNDSFVYAWLCLCHKDNSKTWFGQMINSFEINSRTLRKSLNRLLKLGYVEEYQLSSKRNNHTTFYKGYRIIGPIRKSIPICEEITERHRYYFPRRDKEKFR